MLDVLSYITKKQIEIMLRKGKRKKHNFIEAKLGYQGIFFVVVLRLVWPPEQ